MAESDNKNILTGKNDSDTEQLSFEAAMDRLESLVSDMERGSIPLEENIKSYEEGTKLVKRCQELLDLYSKKIVETAGGELIE